MTALMKIQSFIQAYVQAIASVLDADVTVVDNELVRVAGTGVYADEIGKTVTHGNFFNQILQSGENGIITDVMMDANCLMCEKRATCKELANVAYPIFKDGAVVGIISIIAFDDPFVLPSAYRVHPFRERQSPLRGKSFLQAHPFPQMKISDTYFQSGHKYIDSFVRCGRLHIRDSGWESPHLTEQERFFRSRQT